MVSGYRHVGSLQQTEMGVFTPLQWANTKNQYFLQSPLLHICQCTVGSRSGVVEFSLRTAGVVRLVGHLHSLVGRRSGLYGDLACSAHHYESFGESLGGGVEVELRAS